MRIVSRIVPALVAVGKEPPFRRLAKPLIRALPFSPAVKCLWDAAERPHYLLGVLHAAAYANHGATSVIEFGVAAGHGLLALQRCAEIVERAAGVRIHVYGFDTGSGLPKGTGDYRDHSDYWQPADFTMDPEKLRMRLHRRTELVLGDVADTVKRQAFAAPIGFIAFDLDLYSSTAAALSILRRADVPRSRRVALYFDDVNDEHNHCFAGELLAIDEFNRAAGSMRIDRWRGLRRGRPFPEAAWLDCMYLAHDLEAITNFEIRPRRPARVWGSEPLE
jgi:hypothetical protein